MKQRAFKMAEKTERAFVIEFASLRICAEGIEGDTHG
jgi:hypothetical protein